MRLVKWAVLSVMMGFGLACPVWAVTPANIPGTGMTSATGNASETIERGGTITAVDPSSRSISVDGTRYTLSYSVQVYDETGRQTSRNNLRKRMLIRFNTTPNKYSGHYEVVKIWMEKPYTRSPQK